MSRDTVTVHILVASFTKNKWNTVRRKGALSCAHGGFLPGSGRRAEMKVEKARLALECNGIRRLTQGPPRLQIKIVSAHI